jgi:hypothetical protein
MPPFEMVIGHAPVLDDVTPDAHPPDVDPLFSGDLQRRQEVLRDLDAGRRPKRSEDLGEHRFALRLDVDAHPKDLLVRQQIQIIAALLSAR